MEKKIILLADDDSDDTEMFREALAYIDNSIVCHSAVNGTELLDKLNGLPEKPQLIFLDLNMPVMNGWECLKRLKEDKRYQHIPVIMISTSSHKKEMDMASALGAFCYFVKPSNFNEFTRILKVITSSLGSGLREVILHLQGNSSGHIFLCGEDNPGL